MRTISVVATMIVALLSPPLRPSLADAQQAAPAGPFDVLVGKWTGTAQERGARGKAQGLTNFEMVIEKVASDGTITGKFARKGEKKSIGTWKAEKNGDSIHLFFESKGDKDTFDGRLVNQNQIDGRWASIDSRGRASSEELSFTREQ